MKSIPGLRLQEMERHRNKSFCCGAGGGRMWMEETLGTRRSTRPAPIRRWRSSPELIAVSCPFCTIMLEDGLKARDQEEMVKVYDIAELLAQSLETDKVIDSAGFGPDSRPTFGLSGDELAGSPLEISARSASIFCRCTPPRPPTRPGA